VPAIADIWNTKRGGKLDSDVVLVSPRVAEFESRSIHPAGGMEIEIIIRIMRTIPVLGCLRGRTNFQVESPRREAQVMSRCDLKIMKAG
jgi:hypothetical protein